MQDTQDDRAAWVAALGRAVARAATRPAGAGAVAREGEGEGEDEDEDEAEGDGLRERTLSATSRDSVATRDSGGEPAASPAAGAVAVPVPVVVAAAREEARASPGAALSSVGAWLVACGGVGGLLTRAGRVGVQSPPKRAPTEALVPLKVLLDNNELETVQIPADARVSALATKVQAPVQRGFRALCFRGGIIIVLVAHSG